MSKITLFLFQRINKNQLPPVLFNTNKGRCWHCNLLHSQTTQIKVIKRVDELQMKHICSSDTATQFQQRKKTHTHKTKILCVELLLWRDSTTENNLPSIVNLRCIAVPNPGQG